MLKREARVLGLSGTTVRGRTIVVSVVFRGALWLDGIATCVMDARERNYLPKVSDLIKKSKQFSQLHAILISSRFGRNRELSIQDLARKLKLPVIAIKSGKGRTTGKQGVNNFDIEANGKRVLVSAAGVDRDGAERLYAIGCSKRGKTPEAVRVADLLAKELTRIVPNRGPQPGTK